MTEAKKTTASKSTAKAADDKVADSGPGTGTEAPADEQPRSTESTVVLDPESGPIVAPDHALQVEPKDGYDLSSTDHVYAAAGGHTVAGERFDALVDENDKKVSPDALFKDDGKTFLTTTKRVYEQFYYPNTTTVAKRLLFVEGQRVNRAEAERVKATLG